MGWLMDGPVKKFATQALELDIHGRADVGI
jgi:hypothetical protein